MARPHRPWAEERGTSAGIESVRRMLKMMMELKERIKGRIGIYGTGWNPESVMGLLLPFIVVGIMALMGWLLVEALNAM
jgi:hypothetical protein